MQNYFLGSHLRYRNQDYLTLYFACRSDFLGTNLRLTNKTLNSWSSTVFCKMSHFKQWVHLSAVWEAVLFPCLAGISRLIPKRISEHHWTLNKIQTKRCAPVSLCSGGSLGKLLLADLGLCRKYSSFSWILPVVCFSHASTWRVSTLHTSHGLLRSLRMANVAEDADDQQVSFFHDAFSSFLVLFSGLWCLI